MKSTDPELEKIRREQEKKRTEMVLEGDQKYLFVPEHEIPQTENILSFPISEKDKEIFDSLYPIFYNIRFDAFRYDKDFFLGELIHAIEQERQGFFSEIGIENDDKEGKKFFANRFKEYAINRYMKEGKGESGDESR